MCKKKFCSIPSRLFSGDPTALLTPLAQLFSAGATTPDLTTPYTFQFDTNQVPDTQFWHLTKISITIFNPNSNLAPNLDLIKLMMMPNNLVGTAAQESDGTINIGNAGIELNRTNSDLANSAGGSGWQSIFFPDCDLPPRWFLRVAILDDGSGSQELPPGSSVLLRTVQSIVPTNFASMD